MTRRMDPLIKILYWHFLKTRGVAITFLLEGFGGERAVEFVRKYAEDNTELAIIAKHCHKDRKGKFNIDWELVNKETKGLTSWV